MKMNEFIRRRRKELGLSQLELAEKCGYTNRSTISRIENGSRDVPSAQLRRIAKALDLDPALLVAPEETAYLVTDPDIDLVVETMRTRPDLAAEIMKYVRYLLSQEA